MITEFGKLLRIIRINTGDSARTMAEKFGMSPSYLSTIENGKRNIPPEMEELVIRAYDLSEHDKEKLRKTIIDTTAQLKVDLTEMEEKKKNPEDKAKPKTSHTLNPVPFIIRGADIELKDGDFGLSNVAATAVELMGLEVPEGWNESMLAKK